MEDFDCDKLCKNFSLIVFAKRRSGKSYLIRELVNKIVDRFDYIVVKSAVDESCRYFKKELNHDKVLCSKYVVNDKVLKALQRKKDSKRVLIIMDDIQGIKSTRYDQSIADLFVAGRHKGISCILINQNFTMMGKQIRENSDYIVMFKNSSKTYEQVIESYLLDNDISGKDFENDKECKQYFKNVFKELFKVRYMSCVLDNVTNCMYKFKAS